MPKILGSYIRIFARDADVENVLFSDWFDVADWLKQRQEYGMETTILGWQYVKRPNKRS